MMSEPPVRPELVTTTASKSVPWGLLVAVFTGPFMALLDLSIVTVALPAMQASLHATFSALQWVIDGYTLALSALLLTAGSLGDRYGRKRLYLAGIALFTVGSAICAAAPGAGVLVAGRVIQGAAATSLIPGSLSILTQAFPDPARRARMFGLWGGVGSVGVALGPVLGGVLADEVGWWAIFLINLPVGILAVILGARSITESADPAHAAVDLAGQVTGIAWLGALTFGLIEGGSHGWSAAITVVPLVLAAIALAAFLVVESRSARPMLPLALFRRPAFATASLASFALGFGAYSVFTFMSLYLQDVQGYSAVSAGLRYLPLCATIAVVSVLAGRLVGRFGSARSMAVGYGITGAALVAMVGFGPATGYLVIAVVFAFLGAGMGLAITPTTAAAMGSVQRQRSGIASGTVNATRQAGSTLGIAVLGAIITSLAVTRLRRALTGHHLSRTTAQRIASATVTAHGASGPATSAGLAPGLLHQLYDTAFIGGLHVAVLTAGIITLLAAALALFQLRRPPTAGEVPVPGRSASCEKTTGSSACAGLTECSRRRWPRPTPGRAASRCRRRTESRFRRRS
jgi:MFS transporter, DHA2 family, methylenomycin A resistance protein